MSPTAAGMEARRSGVAASMERAPSTPPPHRPAPWWGRVGWVVALSLAVGCSRSQPDSQPAATPRGPRVAMVDARRPQLSQKPTVELAGDWTASLQAASRRATRAVGQVASHEPAEVDLAGGLAGGLPTAEQVLGAAHGKVVAEVRFPGKTTAIDRAVSQSVGTPQTGRLLGGTRLPVASDPHVRALARTAKADTLWGTSELVALVRDVAAAVARQHGQVPLTVGNLSRRGGGDIGASVSHNSGRDADLAFYLLDARGKSVRWHTMLHCDDSGVVQRPADARGFRFDTARNWALIRHLLSHPAVVVQWIFVAAPLRNMLLDHALRVGEPASLRERARRVLVQPSDSARHDDHFHVRIACPPGDSPACRSGPGRTRYAREAQIDALLHMYRKGSPAERRYAREILSLPVDGGDLVLPPVK